MDLFDEIVETLKNEQDVNKYTYIEPKTLDSFFSTSSVPQPQKEACKSNRNAPNSGLVSRPSEKRSSTSVRGNVDYSNLDIPQLKELVSHCNKCDLCRSRNNTVFGEGDVTADLMLIGEGPGRDEDIQGRPFVGKSGQLLTKMLKAIGFDRDKVFITNIVKCRPPQNRNPFPEEANACMPYLMRQIELIQPKVLLLLGAVPMKFILNKTGITRIHGQWFEFNGIKTLPTFHPSFLLRDPRQKKHAWEDLQKVMDVFGKKHVR